MLHMAHDWVNSDTLLDVSEAGCALWVRDDEKSFLSLHWPDRDNPNYRVYGRTSVRLLETNDFGTAADYIREWLQ